jgi:hypothetical protein
VLIHSLLAKLLSAFEREKYSLSNAPFTFANAFHSYKLSLLKAGEQTLIIPVVFNVSASYMFSYGAWLQLHGSEP